MNNGFENNITMIKTANQKDSNAFWLAVKSCYVDYTQYNDDIGLPISGDEKAALSSTEYYMELEEMCHRETDPLEKVFFVLDDVKIGYCLFCKQYIFDFSIFPQYRNRGLGKKCYALFKSTKTNINTVDIELNVSSSNSKSFWEKLSFTYNGYNHAGVLLMIENLQKLPYTSCVVDGKDHKILLEILGLTNSLFAQKSTQILSPQQQGLIIEHIEKQQLVYVGVFHGTRLVGYNCFTSINTEKLTYDHQFILPSFSDSDAKQVLSTESSQFSSKTTHTNHLINLINNYPFAQIDKERILNN